MAGAVTGPSSKNRDNIGQIASVNGVDAFRHGLDVIPHQYVQVLASDAVEAGSTTSVINATAHVANEGDILRFTSGANQAVEVVVYRATANTITLAQELSVAPSVSDTFDVLRHTSPVVASDGQVQVDVDVATTQYALQLDDAGSGVTYIGDAVPGTATSAATWRVKRMTETGADIAIDWADGDADFDNIWDNRASLSYS